ncbi:outer membrane protein assembly factor BamA [Buchnera aphidicola]|uniref:outer membrane protein assembly factor BamA n=1 Tax=Buchnera aphidicola TaxID=9 RepID=UPI003464B89D
MGIKKIFLSFLIICSLNISSLLSNNICILNSKNNVVGNNALLLKLLKQKKLSQTNNVKENFFLVNHILFKGLVHSNEQDLRNSLTFKEGEKFTENDINDSINILMNSKKFETIEVKKIQNEFVFIMKEFSILKNIDIEENANINGDFIKKLLNDLNISLDHYVRDVDVFSLKKKLVEAYSQDSMPNVNIEVFLNVDKNNISTLKILISKKLNTYFREIKIVGNEKFSYSILKDVFQFNKTISYSAEFFKDEYNVKDLNKDLLKLKQFYINKGYLKFKISNISYNYANNSKDLYITIHIQEGHHYNLAKIFFNENYPNILLEKEFVKNLKLHNIYDVSKFDAIKENLKNFLSEKGYLQPNILIIPELNEFNHTVNLQIKVDKGEIFFVNKINFKGNTNFSTEFLKQIISQKEGVIFNSNKIYSDLKSLQLTNYFNDINITISPLHEGLNLVDINFEVIEKNKKSAEMNAGYNKRNGVHFHTGFTTKHIISEDDNINVNSEVLKDEKSININYNKGNFFLNKSEYNLNFFYNEKKYVDYADLHKKKSSFDDDIFEETYGFPSPNSIITNFLDSDVQTYGVQANIKKLINSENSFNVNVGYKYQKNFNYIQKKIDQYFHNEVSHNNNKDSSELYINSGWTCSNLFDEKDSMNKYNILFSVDSVFPVFNKSYYKFKIDSDTYFLLDHDNNFIFHIHEYLGHGSNFLDTSLPQHEKFFMSYENFIKGFNNKNIGPLFKHSDNLNKDYDQENFSNCDDFLVNSGGNTISVSNIEFIFPSLSLIDSTLKNYAHTSLFLDFGNVWKDIIPKKSCSSNKMIYKNFGSLYSSCGIACSIKVPIGDFCLSYAIPIGKYAFDVLEPFQINFRS